MQNPGAHSAVLGINIISKSTFKEFDGIPFWNG